MNALAARRVWALVYRHLALFRRSWPRVIELMYWPVLEMLVWGFTTRYLVGLGSELPGSTPAMLAATLLGGALLWEVTLRQQMGMSVSFLEEIWSRNLGHLAVSPLRPRELVAGLVIMGLLRMAVGVVPAALLAWGLYGLGIGALGPAGVLCIALLAMMGWAVALGVMSLVLRHGAGAEALAWSVVYGLTPFAAVFYPVATLPAVVQPIAWALPASHVFEAMRAILLGGGVPWGGLAVAFVLNLAWLALMGWVFTRALHDARNRGALLTMGE